jgi:DNA invertase Pin-like site-specific DNA recombinase
LSSFYSDEPTLYLYSRVSTDRQTVDGKMGMYRQTENEMIDKVIARFSGMPVVNISDPGSSGFKGDNTSKGQLGTFIQNCDDGLVAPGSVIAMEELDRFTRLNLTSAQGLVTRVLEANVKIYVWNNSKTFTKDNLMSAFEVVLELQGAHMHSKKISKRVTESALDKVKLILKTKRKKGELCPSVGGYGHTKWWADTSSGFVKPDKYYWPIAKEMVQLVLSGMGWMRMREYLTERYEPPTVAHNKDKNGWGENIPRVFHSCETILGVKRFNFKETIEDDHGNKTIVNKEYVIKDYYPVLCTIEEFEKMAAVKQRNRTSNKSGSATGIFTNIDICRCGFCGLTINTFRSKADNFEKMALRYKCAGMNTKTTGCVGKSVDSKIIETAIIKMIGVAICQPQPEINNNKKFEIQQALKDVQKRIKNASESLVAVGPSDSLIQMLKSSQDKKVRLEARLEEIYRKANVKIDIEDPIDYLGQIPAEVLKWTKNDARYELKEQLRKYVKSIKVKITDKLCDIKIELKNGVVIKACVIRLKYLVYRNAEELYEKSEEHGGLSTLWFAEQWHGTDRHGEYYNLMSDAYIERYSEYHQKKFIKAAKELYSKVSKNKDIINQ